MKNLYKKLLLIQQEVGAITKDSENPFFKSKYFDINSLLADIKPLFNKHGVIVVQPLTNLEGKPAIETLVIDEESGDQIKSICPLPENIDPQKMGSAITYYRRYSLQSLFLLMAEDDDGNAASAPVAPRPTQEKKSSFPASDKQKAFIKKLVSERNRPMPEASWFDTLDMTTAKATIDALLAAPVSNERIVDTDGDEVAPIKDTDIPF
jgi:hypothetical protein